MAPVFSIVIPCYNQAHYLKQAVDSVKSQNTDNWQLVIVNDGATDHTAELATELCGSDDRIVVLQQQNQGLAAARNNGLQLCTGKCVLFLDADDTLRENALEQFSSALLHADIAVSGYNYFNDLGTIHHEVIVQQEPKALLTRNIAPPVAVAMRVDALKHTGLFDVHFNPAEDWDLWCRFYKAGKRFAIIPTILVDYRVVDNSMSRNAHKMYHGMKLVALQAIRFDSRIKTASPQNTDQIEVDFAGSIRHSLSICLGLLLTQGKIREAEELYRTETSAYGLVWQRHHYEAFCSYLSFRYFYTRSQLQQVINEIRPNFQKFLAAIQLSESDQKAILSSIFDRYNYLYRRKRFGVLAALHRRIFK